MLKTQVLESSGLRRIPSHGDSELGEFGQITYVYLSLLIYFFIGRKWNLLCKSILL